MGTGRGAGGRSVPPAGAGARTWPSTGTREPVAELCHAGRRRPGRWAPGATPPHGAPAGPAHGAGGLPAASPSPSVNSAQTPALAGWVRLARGQVSGVSPGTPRLGTMGPQDAGALAIGLRAAAPRPGRAGPSSASPGGAGLGAAGGVLSCRFRRLSGRHSALEVPTSSRSPGDVSTLHAPPGLHRCRSGAWGCQAAPLSQTALASTPEKWGCLPGLGLRLPSCEILCTRPAAWRQVGLGPPCGDPASCSRE